MSAHFESISALRRLLRPHRDPALQQQSRELLLSLSGHLDRAPLRDIHLINMSLRAIDLRRVILARAHLIDVDLTDADLRGADLRSATLRGVTLAGTRLQGARLKGARFFDTSLCGARLGAQPDLDLLGRRDCYVCGGDGDEPCTDLETGQPLDEPHAQRWRPHSVAGRRCEACGAPPLGLCPGVPLFFSWASVPDRFATRPRLVQLGVVPDGQVDAFMQRRVDRVPLFDLVRLVG